jgi:hypothetical protein
MIALRSRHFRKRTPDLHNSARFNTIPALRAIKMNPVLKKISRSSPSWIGLHPRQRRATAPVPWLLQQCVAGKKKKAKARRENRDSPDPPVSRELKSADRIYRGPIHCGPAKEACIEGMCPATAGRKSDKSTYLVHWEFSDSGPITTVTLTEAVMTEYLLGTSCFSPHAVLYPF